MSIGLHEINKERLQGDPAPEGRQVSRRMEKKIIQNISMNYLLYLPSDYDPEKEWPIVFFLHGAGERGTDLNLVKKHGPPMLIEEGKGFPFILISPQCPKYLWWADKIPELKEIINDVCGLYSVDMNRIYITGLSMGGFGTFSMAKAYPELFAAAVPICGGLKGEGGMDKVKHVPFWIFHGENDDTVPVDMSKKATDIIKKSGGNAKLTIYPKTGHNSWTETYDNPEVYNWMLKQKRGRDV